LEVTTFAEAVSKLQAEAGRPAPSNPQRLAFGEINTAVEVFQPRDVEADFLASDAHVKTLAEAVKEGGVTAFDPITVWWSGQRWYVLDGHHRLLALRQAREKHERLKDETVPVTVFNGSLNEAISQSVALNSKDKLPMKKADKLERAWKLVCLDDSLSKKRIHEVTTISEGTIAAMRRKRRELLDRGEQPLEWLWDAAKNDIRQAEYDEDWQEQQAKDWVKRLVKLFDKKLIEQPEIAARALQLYSQRLPLELARCWPEEVKTVAEEVAEQEF
jgi:ParB-like chromosome segregation protein Spo0J